MQFKDVIGQAESKRHLAEMMQDNRLAHALLFLGKEGSGTLPLAIAFAQYVVCETVNGKSTASLGPSLFADELPSANQHQKKANDSCGLCSACLKAQQLVHPDIHFSYPSLVREPNHKPISTDYIVEWRDFINTDAYCNATDWVDFLKSHPKAKIQNATNKQGNITAAECNDIIRKISLKSFESEYKILILWMPENLVKEGNKLLKLIEEPPPNTLFILVAENESLILPTILSRCQLIKIPALETKDIEEALISRKNIAASTARQVASVSEGNYREALQLVQHSDEDWQSLLRDWLNAIMKTGPIAQTKWVEDISKLGREKQKQFLRYFNHLLEQAIRLGVTSSQPSPKEKESEPASSKFSFSIPDNERDFALRLNKIAGIEQQQAIIEELDKASYFIERNANAKMLFHALTIKLYHIIQDKIVFLTD
jgi:DNA polymerase-3 subunit delta'